MVSHLLNGVLAACVLSTLVLAQEIKASPHPSLGTGNSCRVAVYGQKFTITGGSPRIQEVWLGYLPCSDYLKEGRA